MSAELTCERSWQARRLDVIGPGGGQPLDLGQRPDAAARRDEGV